VFAYHANPDAGAKAAKQRIDRQYNMITLPDGKSLGKGI
jgi:hypothetical protein